ncbi:MAG: hypothetical protein U0169_08585 [Polyangiaceae bacterium]
MRAFRLKTRALPNVAPAGVFDDFGWCTSDTLEWRAPSPGSARAFDATTGLDGSDPARMVFVFRRPCDFLPVERASLHAFDLGLTDEWALAPYAIDDATDGFWERRTPPGDWMWLAADNLNALYWGLHDWAHFHNHGPFERRAWTELHCDRCAFAWLVDNREVLELDAPTLARVRREILALVRRRFVDEGEAIPPDLESWWAVPGDD